jgi:hypothetical protein
MFRNWHRLVLEDHDLRRIFRDSRLSARRKFRFAGVESVRVACGYCNHGANQNHYQNAVVLGSIQLSQASVRVREHHIITKTEARYRR